MFRLVIFSCLILVNFASSSRPAKPTEGRIIGGHDRDISVVPHQVSVHYKNVHKCGGSIIGPKHVLTAAHCVAKRNHDLFSIRAGSNYHNKDGQEIKVVKVVSHPKYNSKIFDNDAAVLLLEEPLTFGEKVQVATLANDEPRPGDMALISGWGSIKAGERNTTSFLQSVVVPVVSKKVCEIKHSFQQITNQMFCAGYLSGGQDSCYGDSGGPVMVKNKLAGIVSWGVGCAQKNFPGVNTSVASIFGWISAQIKK